MSDHSLKPYYETLFHRLRNGGLTTLDAADAVATAFLDGKPQKRGKHKTTWADRHAAFWSADFLHNLPKDAWASEPVVLALARYLSQDRYTNETLIEQVATAAPDTVKRAARYSGLVLRQSSPRRSEIESLGRTHPAQFRKFNRVFEILDLAHGERNEQVAFFQESLAALTPVELLAYASLYAFEHLVPPTFVHARGSDDADLLSAWDAINDILTWKLTTCPSKSFQLSDRVIGLSLQQHLSPFLLPSSMGLPPREDLRQGFQQLMEAQMELNSFVSQSADAFSYDDGIRFVCNGNRLGIVDLVPSEQSTWTLDGEKLKRLHGYWLYRGMDALLTSESILAMVGPENREWNLQAFAKAMSTQLQLQEVYGLADTVHTESGLHVDVFRALLAMELMTAFFIKDFMLPYGEYQKQLGNWRLALGRLAFGGLLQPDKQNRFPLTWSDKAAKIERIKSWTVSPEFPHGHAKAAEAILDFWTSDWSTLSARLKSEEKQSGLQPELFERPMLKIGRYLFQLPWMVAMQNNATAAINNLRRIGSRRKEVQAETGRIEHRMGKRFEERGFRVLVNYRPPVQEEGDAGEIDLICARDGQLLVLEVKSGFVRRSKRDSWLHGTTTLRTAGLQLCRKLPAVRQALASDPDFLQSLGLSLTDGLPTVAGWIVDTSIECDHQRFNGFLKVSLEEVLIALRDDRRLLNDPDGLLRGKQEDAESPSDTQNWTLYPDGFSTERFVEVIEQALVWALPA